MPQSLFRSLGVLKDELLRLDNLGDGLCRADDDGDGDQAGRAHPEPLVEAEFFFERLKPFFDVHLRFPLNVSAEN